MDLWIAEMAMPTPKYLKVVQINVIISQKILHWEATFYPELTVQVIVEIPPDIP